MGPPRTGERWRRDKKGSRQAGRQEGGAFSGLFGSRGGGRGQRCYLLRGGGVGAERPGRALPKLTRCHWAPAGPQGCPGWGSPCPPMPATPWQPAWAAGAVPARVETVHLTSHQRTLSACVHGLSCLFNICADGACLVPPWSWPCRGQGQGAESLLFGAREQGAGSLRWKVGEKGASP